MKSINKKLSLALMKPLPAPDYVGDEGTFDPWEDVIHGIAGCYSSESDELMIQTLKAVRDRTTFDLIEKHGFIVEFMLYVLAGHDLTEYGTSPRGAWPAPEAEDLWQELINKWESYSAIVWRS